MLGRTNTGGGGSGGLNFQVIGGTTAPNNPKENTIWVNTSTKITDWVFSATQPTAASGRVWITTGTSSTVEFNALKKNGIQVYPISAKQYISGAWMEKTAKSYQGSEWVEWLLYIYDNGNQYESITGGWTPTSFNNSVNTPSSNYCNVAIENDRITFNGVHVAGDYQGYANISTANTIDLSQNKFLRCKATGTVTAKHFAVGVSSSPGSATPVAFVTIDQTGEYELDISALDTGYVFAAYTTTTVFGAEEGSSDIAMEISEIALL